MRNTQYNYKLGKGCGLVDETLTLLSVFQKGMSKDELYNYVHDTDALSKCTELRCRDIVKLVFYPRFVLRNSNVPLWLKLVRERGLMLPQFKQLLMLYCARENAIMYDYLKDEFNDLRLSNESKVNSEKIRAFVDNIVESGKACWSETTCVRQVRNLRGVLMDFDMIDSKYNILPYEVADFTILYLMHELHFEGLSDIAIWNHEDWQLFGLDKYQVGERIMELNFKGGYIAQCTGDLMTISWKYNSMEEFINGTL